MGFFFFVHVGVYFCLWLATALLSACADINKFDFIIHLTGCDYMVVVFFVPFVVTTTLDVLLPATAEDDGKIKRSVNTSSCYLLSPTYCPSHVPARFQL